MKLRTVIIVAVSAILAESGCDKNPLGVVETQGHAPTVSNVTLSPTVVRIDTVKPVNGTYTLNLVVSAKASDPDGYANIGTVQSDIVGPSGDRLLTVTMHDDGVAPDAVRGDEVFTARVDLPISREMTGRYYPFVIATDQSGFQSNAVSTSFLVFRQRNSPPRLSNLIAPDTLHVQQHVKVPIPMHVTAADSDGQGDIKEVYFLSLSSSSPTTHYQLLDDGGGTNGESGDQVAGDGVYSIIVQLDPDSNATKPNYLFQFQAKDAPGDTSGSLFHTIFITFH